MNDPQILPEHVQRMIHRSDEVQFTPPSFERWLGRLQMVRILAAMGAFLLVWLVSYQNGQGWDGATTRAIIAAMVFHFFAWAAGLFVFGELYDVEVKEARRELEERERDRARRIEEYYRERLRAQGVIAADEDVQAIAGGVVPSVGESVASVTPIPSAPGAARTGPGARRAA